MLSRNTRSDLKPLKYLLELRGWGMPDFVVIPKSEFGHWTGKVQLAPTPAFTSALRFPLASSLPLPRRVIYLRGPLFFRLNTHPSDHSSSIKLTISCTVVARTSSQDFCSLLSCFYADFNVSSLLLSCVAESGSVFLSSIHYVNFGVAENVHQTTLLLTLLLILSPTGNTLYILFKTHLLNITNVCVLATPHKVIMSRTNIDNRIETSFLALTLWWAKTHWETATDKV